jgi:hypothetical protein
VSNFYTWRDLVENIAPQAAYKLNLNKEFHPQPPVYAILTDLKDFYFFSYDGSTFKMDKEIRVSSATRVEFFNGMGDGSFLSQFSKRSRY